MSENIDKLIKDHTPILWLNPHEAFLPEDCEVMVKEGDLYKKGKNPRLLKKFKKTLADLANYDSQYFLKLPEIDMREFKVSPKHGIPGSGPDAVAELAKRKYANNPFSTYTARQTLRKYYVRIGYISLRPKVGTSTEEMGEEQIMRKYFGNYTVIQYFFFYIFNDFWNKHVGDWDSTIEILIKEGGNEKYAIYSMHETNWFVKLGQSNNDLRIWIENDWEKNKKFIGTAFVIGSHPFGFVAKGSHGVYPTPGHTFYGLDFPGFDAFVGASDERVIGYTCILPENIEVDYLKKLLANTKPPIGSTNLKDLKWNSYEILKDQPWLKYKGLWGEDARDLKGWDGPEGPARDKWKTVPEIIYEKIKSTVQGGYNKDFIFRNWDGIP